MSKSIYNGGGINGQYSTISGPTGSQGPIDQQDQQDHKEYKDQQAHKVFKVLPDQMDRKGFKD